jgi:hypothetical protein
MRDNKSNNGIIVNNIMEIINISISKKAFPLHATKSLGGEKRYSSYSFSTSALDEVSGQRHAPAAH